MSIHLFNYEDAIVGIAFQYPKDFIEIYDQLHAEYLFGGFNEDVL